jgi:hypothetical protein
MSSMSAEVIQSRLVNHLKLFYEFYLFSSQSHTGELSRPILWCWFVAVALKRFILINIYFIVCIPSPCDANTVIPKLMDKIFANSNHVLAKSNWEEDFCQIKRHYPKGFLAHSGM